MDRSDVRLYLEHVKQVLGFSSSKLNHASLYFSSDDFHRTGRT